MTASINNNAINQEIRPLETNHHDIGNSFVAAAGHNNQNTSKKCFFCGKSPYHNRIKCPARNAVCKKCSKQGHWEVVCRSSSVNAISDGMFYSSPGLYAIGAFNSKVVLTVSVNKKPAQALGDTGANLTCVSEAYAGKSGLKIDKCQQKVKLAAKFSITIIGHVIVDLKVKGHTYRAIRVAVLPDLVKDVILGTDLMQQHKSVTFNFGGERPPMVLNSVGEMRVTAPSLFNNLTGDIHPVAAKSRRYSLKDQRFIKEEIDKLLSAGVIESSNSPWRAQLLVERSENHRDRLVVDYAQTINRFTLLDAYPLPNMDDVASKLALYDIYSAFDLRSAFHQVKLPEEDKIYTAFQAGQRLFQFCRVPFGLRNSS